MKDVINLVNDIRNKVEPNIELQNKLSSMFGFGNAFQNNVPAVDKINNTALMKNLGLINPNTNWSSVLRSQLGWLESLQLKNDGIFSSVMNNHIELIKSLQPISDIQRDKFLNLLELQQQSPFIQSESFGNALNMNLGSFTEKSKPSFFFDEDIKWEEELELMDKVIDEILPSNQENTDFPHKEEIMSVMKKVFYTISNTTSNKNLELTKEDVIVLKYILAFLPVLVLLFTDKIYADLFCRFYTLLLSIFIIPNENKNK